MKRKIELFFIVSLLFFPIFFFLIGLMIPLFIPPFYLKFETILIETMIWLWLSLLVSALTLIFLKAIKIVEINIDFLLFFSSSILFCISLFSTAFYLSFT